MGLNVLWKQPDLRRQLLFTLLAVVIYRLASHIPLPGIAPGALEKAPEAALALPQPVYLAWAVWTLCRIIVDYYHIIEARLNMMGYYETILVR